MRIGTAGWSLPRESQVRFPDPGTHLERYARVLDAAEINSTFHRPHRRSTYERWAASVPGSFRFSVKMPKAISHTMKLADTAAAVDTFLDELSPLRERVACLLVQLPPSAAFDAVIARSFFRHLRKRFDEGIALEPRHASWFERAPDRLLESLRVARVVADPLRAAEGAEPGGWRELAYFRLHGSPRIYYSSYDAAFLDRLAERLAALREGGTSCWCIFDNTTLGAGTANALDLVERIRGRDPAAALSGADLLPPGAIRT